MNMTLLALCLRLLRIPYTVECRIHERADSRGPGRLAWQHDDLKDALRRFQQKRSRRGTHADLTLVVHLDTKAAEPKRKRVSQPDLFNVPQNAVAAGALVPNPVHQAIHAQLESATPHATVFKVKRDLVEAVGSGGMLTPTSTQHGDHHDRSEDAQGARGEGSSRKAHAGEGGEAGEVQARQGASHGGAR